METSAASASASATAVTGPPIIIQQISDRDVLAVVLPSTSSTVTTSLSSSSSTTTTTVMYDLDVYRGHIGNCRFGVLVDMYHDAFQQNYNKNDVNECDKIIKLIVDAICQNDVKVAVTTNRGRFVVRGRQAATDPTIPSATTNTETVDDNNNNSSNNIAGCSCCRSNDIAIEGWRCLDEEGSKELVRQALLRGGSNSSSSWKDDTNDYRKDDDDNDDESDDDALIEQLLEPLPISAHNVGGFASEMGHSMASIDFGNLELNDDGNKKRGRRQSLLRRSASETTMLLDKKKLYRDLIQEDASLRELSPLPSGVRRYHSNAGTNTLPPPPPPQQQAMGRAVSIATSIPGSAIPSNLRRNSAYSSGGAIVPSFRGMDVVLTSDRKSLSARTEIVGNNRLRVSLNLEKGRYMDMSHEQQIRVATDLVKTVTEYWDGHILVENLFVYNILSLEEAVEAFQNLLSAQEETGGSSSSSPYGYISDPVVDAVTSSSTVTATTTTVPPGAPQSSDYINNNNNTPQQQQQQQPTLLSSAPPVPEFLRQLSRDVLNGARDDTAIGPEQLQSDARRSLQQRQAKRQISKGLGSGRNFGP